MSRAKTRSAKPQIKRIVRQPSTLTARVKGLETRIAQWGLEHDAQFAGLAQRIETLEKRASLSGSNTDQRETHANPARLYALERRVAELEAAIKLQE